MKIETSRGKTFDAEFICLPLRDKSKAIIELNDTRSLAEIAADFDGLDWLKKIDDDGNGSVYEVFEGFNRLIGIQRDLSDDGVRVTLSKGA